MNKFSSVLVLLGLSSGVYANPDVTSREYKLMLDASLFSYNTEASNVDSFLDDAEIAIEMAIDRNVTGSESLEKNRAVTFYDTDGDCQLKELGYSFRERIENGDSEVTLKFRSPDRYISDFEDLSANSSSAATKLESDIGTSSVSTFKAVYSHSTTIDNTRTINEIEDINDEFPGFEDDYNLSNSINLGIVGNITIREHVYRGHEIDLGQHDADISVTLWYNGTPSGNDQPVVVEVSFKYEDSGADYTKKVVHRAKEVFNSLQDLTTWTNPNSQTKTGWIYAYDPNFCN